MPLCLQARLLIGPCVPTLCPELHLQPSFQLQPLLYAWPKKDSGPSLSTVADGKGGPL